MWGRSIMRYDVFISHSSKDGALAQAICASIESRGMRCWIAPRDIEPGEDWPTAIVSAIDNSCILILLLSRHSNVSAQVKRELERAGSLDMPIIPVRAEVVTPAPALAFFINTAQWLDIPAKPSRDSLEPLITRAQRLAAKRRAEPKPATPSTSMLRLKPDLDARPAASAARAAPPTPKAASRPQDAGTATAAPASLQALASGKGKALLAGAAALVAGAVLATMLLSGEADDTAATRQAPAPAKSAAPSARQQVDCSNPNFPCYSQDNSAPSFVTSEEISGFATVLSIGAIEIQKRRIELAYVEDDPAKSTHELATFVAGGAVLCKPAGSGRKYLCSGGPTNSDLSTYVISRGLARPSAGAPESLMRASQGARR